MRWYNLTGGGSQTETRQYNALGQMTRLTVPGQLDLEYRFSATANDNKAISQKNYISGEELEYQYDSLGRLSRAETTANSGSAPQWGLSWVYDGFGNRLQQNAIKGTVPTQSILVDPVTNRVQSHSFDANGNTTSTPAQGTMTYDVTNRLKTVASDAYNYSPANQRQWKNSDFVLWGADGQRLVTAQVALIGTDLRFTQTSFDSYSHGRRLQVSDRLGSVGSYYPYGDAKSGTVSNADSFATYYRDSTALDYAQQRYYQPASGRFLTTDPLQASAKVGQPDSWNRYPYVLNDPSNLSDPSGLEAQPTPGCNPISTGGFLCMVNVTRAGTMYSGSGFSNSRAEASAMALQSAEEHPFRATRDILTAAVRTIGDGLSTACLKFLNSNFYNNTIGSFYTLAPNGTPILPTFASALSTLILGGPNSNPIVFASGYGSPSSSLFYDPERYVHAFNPGAGTIYWRTDDRDLGDIQNVRASVLHELLHSWVQSDKKIQEFFGIEQDDYFTDNITAKLRSEGCP